MSTLAKYFYTFKISWQQQIEFRLNTFIRLLIAFISLVSVFYLWSNIYGERAALLGYSKPQMVTYYVLVGYLFSAIYASLPIREEIQDGSLSSYITKPISYLSYHYCQTLARRLFRLCLSLPILIGIFFLFRDQLYLITAPKAYLLLLFTSFQAINIVILIDMILNSLEFWMFGSNSLSLVTDTVVSFFAGTLIPIFFLPKYIQQISTFLPFKYVGFFLIDSFLGRLSAIQVATGIVVQTLWTIILLLIVKLIWNAGLKKFEAVGN